MYHDVSIELYKHEWKFGKTRNAVGTRAAGECVHTFFEFSQTFMSVLFSLPKVFFSAFEFSIGVSLKSFHIGILSSA